MIEKKNSPFGRAYIFNISDDGKTITHEQTLSDADGLPNDGTIRFGNPVYIRNDVLVVGAQLLDTTLEGEPQSGHNNRGGVFIYRKTGGVWNLEQRITKWSNPQGNDRYFNIKAINETGTSIVLGCKFGSNSSLAQPGSDTIKSWSGNNWVFDYVGDGKWEEKQALWSPLETESGHRKQWEKKVIYKDNVIVGCSNDYTHVYRYNGEKWEHEVILDRGDSVGYYDNRIVIGDDTNNVLYVYKYNNAKWQYSNGIWVYAGGVWEEESKIFPPFPTIGGQPDNSDDFGDNIQLENDTLIVGERKGGENSYGLLYYFKYRTVTNPSWEEPITLDDNNFWNVGGFSSQDEWLTVETQTTIREVTIANNMVVKFQNWHRIYQDSAYGFFYWPSYDKTYDSTGSYALPIAWVEGLNVNTTYRYRIYNYF